ncbi:MAG: HD domain-containing protein [Candidatus Micrarchaeota archaeon]
MEELVKERESAKATLARGELLSADLHFRTLAHLFPDTVGKLEGMDQRTKYHSLPADEHTLEMVRHLQAHPFVQSLSQRKRSLVLLAAKLHDVGKAHPEGGKPHPKEPGQMQYVGHEQKSAEIAREILQKFDLTPDERTAVEKIVELHADALNLTVPFQALEKNGKISGKELAAFEKFVGGVKQIPGSHTPEGLEENFRLMLAVTHADNKAVVNEATAPNHPQLAEKASTQTALIEKLHSAAPAVLEAVKRKAAGTQQAGVENKEGSYAYRDFSTPKTESGFDMAGLSAALKEKGIPPAVLGIIRKAGEPPQAAEALRKAGHDQHVETVLGLLEKFRRT